MPLIDADKPIMPLSSIAEILNAKIRTLRMYEEKGLIPIKEGKKLFSMNDLRMIAFVHYLANVKKVNASGIKVIQELLDVHMTIEQKEALLSSVEALIEGLSSEEFLDIATL